jgi:tRNA(fMet)-specific endonuclease VapC
VASLVVADTDFVIDYLRGKGQGAELVRDLIGRGSLRLTAITAFELRLGADFTAKRDAILRLTRSRTIPLDLNSALRAGEVRSELLRTGHDIGVADCLQAGICLRYELPLATGNRKHFERVKGLHLFV